MQDKIYRVSPPPAPPPVPEARGSFQLSDLLDFCSPWIRFSRNDKANQAEGVIPVNGDSGPWVSLASSPDSGLLRLDARLGLVRDITPRDALLLLGLPCPPLIRLWLDPEGATLWLQGAVLAKRLKTARYALARNAHQALRAEAFRVVLGEDWPEARDAVA